MKSSTWCLYLNIFWPKLSQKCDYSQVTQKYTPVCDLWFVCPYNMQLVFTKVLLFICCFFTGVCVDIGYVGFVGFVDAASVIGSAVGWFVASIVGLVVGSLVASVVGWIVGLFVASIVWWIYSSSLMPK